MARSLGSTVWIASEISAIGMKLNNRIVCTKYKNRFIKGIAT